MSWFICGCFPDEGSQSNGSGIVILGRRGRNMQLCYCPGSRRPFDWILRKIRSECLHSGQLAQGSVPPAWHGSWLVLVCSGGYNKIPQAGWLINNRYLFLAVLEAGSLRSGCQHGWLRALLPVTDFLCTYAVEGASMLPGASFIWALIPFMRTLPLASNRFPKIPPSNTIHWGLGFQRMNLGWGHKHSDHRMTLPPVKSCQHFHSPIAATGGGVFQSFIHVPLFTAPWTPARQASLSFTTSQSLLKVMSIESVMLSNHLTLCCPLLLLPSIFPSIRVFSNESVLCIRWPKYWRFSFSISPSTEYSGLISFRID